MKRRGRPPYPGVLTPREWEVLEFLRLGLSNEQIAQRLGITLRTAKFHVSEILSKLGVESREQAASWQPEEAPTPTRRWLAWPLAAQIAGALVIVATVVGLGLLAWGVLRTSGDGEQEPLPSDPEGLVKAVLERMESLDSYRMHVADSETGGAATVEVVGTDLVALRTAELESAAPGSVSAQERVITNEGSYDRLCPDYAISCGPWIQNRSNSPSSPMLVQILGTVPSVDWPLIALERAKDIRFLPQDTGSLGITRLIGIFELYATLNETLRRHLPPEEADALAPPPLGPVQAVIQISISRDDALIDRIQIDLPESPLSSRKAIAFDYSDFNEISVVPPHDFLQMPIVPSPTP